MLICAHECSPAQGSECCEGWEIIRRLGKYHNVVALCASGSQQVPHAYESAIREYLTRNGSIRGVQFAFVPQPALTVWLARMNKRAFGMKDGVGIRPLFQMGLKAWHAAAARRADSLGANGFDVIHHLTPIAYWATGNLWRKQPAKYCWGPIGGLAATPLSYSAWLGWKYLLMEVARNSFNLAKAFGSLRLRAALRRSSLLWAIPGEDCRMIERLAAHPVHPLMDVGCVSTSGGSVRSFDGNRPLELYWSGHHSPRKAMPILLKALAQLPASANYRLCVLGQGSHTNIWKSLAMELGLSSKIQWTGKVPRAEAIARMQQADVLVHTSIREAGSHVVLEALNSGLPVLCHDTGGMSAAVNPSCGIKVPLKSPAESISGFRDALLQLFLQPEQIEKLSQGALVRAHELSWDKIAETIANGYSECASSVNSSVEA